MSRRVAALSILMVVPVASSSLPPKGHLRQPKLKLRSVNTQSLREGGQRAMAESSHGSPTILNFDQPYPDQVFSLVIWGGDRSNLGDA
jgi:hypothetical protein